MDGGDLRGGSRELARLIDGYGEELYADFHAYYQLDLVDLLQPGSGFSPRRILVLSNSLPLGSATLAARRGSSQFRGWGVDQYITADLYDAVQHLTYAFVSANSKKKPKQPKPYPRPDHDVEKRKQGNSFRSIAASFISKSRNRKATNGEGTGG